MECNRTRPRTTSREINPTGKPLLAETYVGSWIAPTISAVAQADSNVNSSSTNRNRHYEFHWDRLPPWPSGRVRLSRISCRRTYARSFSSPLAYSSPSVSRSFNTMNSGFSRGRKTRTREAVGPHRALADSTFLGDHEALRLLILPLSPRSAPLRPTGS